MSEWKLSAARKTAEIRAGAHRDDAATTVYHVSDNGVGFDPA